MSSALPDIDPEEDTKIFVPLPEGNLLVVMPPLLRTWLCALARALDAAATAEQGPMSLNLFGPVNPELDQDDVVVVLQRQMAVDAATAEVLDNSTATEITIDQGFDWLRVIQLGLRAVSGPLGDQLILELDVTSELLASVLSMLSFDLCEALSL